MSLISVNWNPPREQLRSFGWISLGAFGLLGALIYYKQRFLGIGMAPETAHAVAYVLWAVGAVSAVLSVVAPAALRPLYIALMAVGLPIGYVVSHIIMGVIFYVILTPIGLVFRLIGRDPLLRRFEPQAATYWIKREPVTDPRRYYRQF